VYEGEVRPEDIQPSTKLSGFGSTAIGTPGLGWTQRREEYLHPSTTTSGGNAVQLTPSSGNPDVRRTGSGS